MKKGKFRIRKLLSPPVIETYELIYSMKYAPSHLKNLSISEVKFLRERCKELGISSIDELIKELNLGITYNEFGIKQQRRIYDKKD